MNYNIEMCIWNGNLNVTILNIHAYIEKVFIILWYLRKLCLLSNVEPIQKDTS